jgi:hypothetical protein
MTTQLPTNSTAAGNPGFASGRLVPVTGARHVAIGGAVAAIVSCIALVALPSTAAVLSVGLIPLRFGTA